MAWNILTSRPGVSCVKPKGALYLFPRLEPKVYNIISDDKFVLDFLMEEKVLLVKGSGFNITDMNHFRIVFLPRVDVLADAMQRLGRFLEKNRKP
jgi:alanine-synthesizing transaminase